MINDLFNDQSPEAYAFLNKHIHARANLLINELLEKSQRDWNLTEYPWYEDLFLQYNQETSEDEENLDSSPREPYEFWIISDYFATKLKENNELLTNHWGFWIWGRETTGQSILIDYIFQKIYNDFKNS